MFLVRLLGSVGGECREAAAWCRARVGDCGGGARIHLFGAFGGVFDCGACGDCVDYLSFDSACIVIGCEPVSGWWVVVSVALVVAAVVVVFCVGSRYFVRVLRNG